VLPRAVLGELEELSLFLDRSSSLEPEPALLDVLEKTMSPTRLARLGLWDCKLDDGGLERLARAPAFRALERLTLGYEKTWSHWRRGALSRARIPEPSRARLLRWQLPDVPARPSDFRPQALARGPRRERLERLEMFFGELTQTLRPPVCSAPKTSPISVSAASFRTGTPACASASPNSASVSCSALATTAAREVGHSDGAGAEPGRRRACDTNHCAVALLSVAVASLRGDERLRSSEA
jgi:hypothetical protein